MTRVLFVLGYLGSGKTTFVKNFLSRHTGKNAVLVNDFGAEDVDGILLEGSAADKNVCVATCNFDELLDYLTKECKL